MEDPCVPFQDEFLAARSDQEAQDVFDGCNIEALTLFFLTQTLRFSDKQDRITGGEGGRLDDLVAKGASFWSQMASATLHEARPRLVRVENLFFPEVGIIALPRADRSPARALPLSPQWLLVYDGDVSISPEMAQALSVGTDDICRFALRPPSLDDPTAEKMLELRQVGRDYSNIR